MSSRQLGVIERINIEIQPKGGGTPMLRIPSPPRGGMITLREGRTSDAKFTLPPKGIVAPGFQVQSSVQPVVPWATEGAIYVNGHEMLTGPVVDTKGGVIEVNDFSAWWKRRDTVAHSIDSDDPVRIFRTVHDAGMAEDDRQRSIYVRGPIVPVEQFTLEDKHFVGAPIRHHVGKVQANFVRMIGGNDENGNPIIVEVRDGWSIARFGLLKRTFRDSKLLSETAVRQAAKTRLANLKFPVRLSIPQGAGLAPSAPIPLSELVPRTIVKVTTSVDGRKVAGLFRISVVKISMDGQVSVDFDPVAEDGEG